MSADLTNKQLAVYEFICSHYRRWGVPPTVREICKEFGWISPNAGMCHITPLITKGFIVRSPHKARGYMPVKTDGRCLRCGHLLGEDELTCE